METKDLDAIETAGYDNRKGQFLSACYKSLYCLNGLMNPGLLWIFLMIF